MRRARRQLVAQALAHPGVDLEPHDLAEAAPAQLLLDRLQQVVGLVGDVVVGVAGDPEERVVEHLHPREERAEVVGDQGVERDQRVRRSSPTLRKPAEQLLRHLDPGEDLVVLLGVAQDHREREREVGDVGERPPAADHERGQDREHLVARTAGRAPRARSAEACSGVMIRIPCSASAGRSSRSKQRPARSRWAITRSRIAARISVGAHPVGRRGPGCPPRPWSCRLATRTMKNSSRFDSQIAANLARSSSGTDSSSASCSTRSLNSSQESSRLK